MESKQLKSLMGDSKVGTSTFKPLKHKKTQEDFDDVDYFELIGRKANQLDKENPNKSLPTDYGPYDRQTVAVAKEVCRGLDAGMKKPELFKYINMCVDYKDN